METTVTQKTALLAKEKGFNIPCWDFIPIDGEQETMMGYIGDNYEEKFVHGERWVDYYLPSQSVLSKWLREVHNIKISVSFYDDGKNQYWTCFIHIRNQREQAYICGKDIFEDALEEGLFEGLKLVSV